MTDIVVLHAAANHHIGVGHLSRTATLATALTKTRFWHQVILVWETNADLAQHFVPPDCVLISVPTRQAALEARTTLIETYSSRGADGVNAVLITDLLNLDPSDFHTARSQGYGVIVHLNDSGSGRRLADLLVDEDGFKSQTDLPEAFQGTGLVGNVYRLVRPAIRQLRPSQPWQRQAVEHVLVTLGGADPANLTLELVQGLCHANAQLPFYLTIVRGPAFDVSQSTALKTIAANHPQLTLVHAPSCLGPLMLEHDVVVTLGGISTYEAMCLGVPCLAISWDFMAFYVESLAQVGLIGNLGSVERSPHALLEWVNDIPKLHQLAQLGWVSIDGQGSDRIAKVIAGLIYAKE